MRHVNKWQPIHVVGEQLGNRKKSTVQGYGNS